MIAVAQQACRRQLLCLIVDDPYPAEGYHAAVEGGVLLGLHVVLLDDAERCLVALLYGIHLVPRQCTVEVELPLVIDVADGYGIRIALVAQQSQGARRSPLQDGNTLFIGKLLTLAPHVPECTHNRYETMCLMSETVSGHPSRAAEAVHHASDREPPRHFSQFP